MHLLGLKRKGKKQFWVIVSEHGRFEQLTCLHAVFPLLEIHECVFPLFGRNVLSAREFWQSDQDFYQHKSPFHDTSGFHSNAKLKTIPPHSANNQRMRYRPLLTAEYYTQSCHQDTSSRWVHDAKFRSLYLQILSLLKCFLVLFREFVIRYGIMQSTCH